jgi:hypothetical protein
VWQDGAPITWSNWLDGEPNGGSTENAAFLLFDENASNDGRWGDIVSTFLYSNRLVGFT